MTGLALAFATKGPWDPHRLLQDVRNAGAGSSSEIHVACEAEHAPDGAPPGLVVHPRPNASLFELWGAAIADTSADWVAILHADATPAQGWFAAMQRAIESEGWSDGYWGPVEPAFGPSDKRMIGYLTEYCQFHRPLDRALKEVPGNNLVLRRRRAGISEDFSKTRLLQQGLSPRCVDDAVVLYARPFHFGNYCGRRFRHGRAYAAARMPRLSRFVAVPMTALLPFLRTARVLRHAWRHELLRGPGLRWLPAVFAAEICWSAGELAGYLTYRSGEVSALD